MRESERRWGGWGRPGGLVEELASQGRQSAFALGEGGRPAENGQATVQRMG